MTKSKSLKPLPYAVLGFQIENFGGIKKTEVNDLPNTARWIFLTGENGFGKTTVLQAVAANLYDHRVAFIDTIPKGFNTIIDIWGEKKAVSRILNHSKGDPIGVFKRSSRDKQLFLRHPIPVFGYGSSRLNISPTEDEKLLSNPIASLFDSRAVLRNIELQLSRWNYKQDDLEFRTKFLAVCDVLKRLLPIRWIEVNFRTDIVTYIELDSDKRGYEPVEFRQLASGFKSIIALVGDMILRLFETQPSVYDPAELEGIVLIDELDLHFHPNLQRELPRLLSEVFPKIQFIATTHSPIPILGAPEGSVFLTVHRNKEEGVTVHRINLDVSELTPNLILTSPIFGFDNIFAETHKASQRIRTEDSMAEKSLNDQVLERLKSFAANDPEVFEKVFKEKPKPA